MLETVLRRSAPDFEWLDVTAPDSGRTGRAGGIVRAPSDVDAGQPRSRAPAQVRAAGRRHLRHRAGLRRGIAARRGDHPADDTQGGGVRRIDLPGHGPPEGDAVLHDRSRRTARGARRTRSAWARWWWT